MTDFKKSNSINTTETRDIKDIAKRTGNLYEAVAIMSKRAVQINKDIKEELLSKLAEFATPSESIEEIFENSEQIEVSKFYERLPKGTLIAVQEFIEENIYHRNTKQDKEWDDAELSACDNEPGNGEREAFILAPGTLYENKISKIGKIEVNSSGI